MNWQLELVPAYILRKHTPFPVVSSFCPSKIHGSDLDPSFFSRWEDAASMFLVSDSTLNLRDGYRKREDYGSTLED
eukprot:12188835-Prorocentrum_lima.AAC.1